VRVYLPATTTVLRSLVEAGQLGPPPLTAFAVTPALREWYLDDDIEALEYAAMLEAARASLRLLDADPQAQRRRVVVSADVPDGEVAIRDDVDRGVVMLAAPVALAAVAAAHVDDASAESTVAAAAGVTIEADLGSASAAELVDDAEGYELGWYATSEIPALLELL
jgi:hypothetical protein